MQCHECGTSMVPNVPFCPTCGAQQEALTGSSASSNLMAPNRPQAATMPQPGASSKISTPLKGFKQNLPQVGETFANRYRVEKYLGLGALCNSYLCRDLGNYNQEVVLKVMHARKAVETGLGESFLFLAQSVAKYNHKGIAKIFDFGKHEGAPYYTMEWVAGVPLRLWLMERLNFENRVLPGLGLVGSLLDTFETIHERGCYGCLKPENVFVTLNGPVVMDFGVVGFLSPQEFEFNSYARRYLPYMAPELRQDWSNLLPYSDYYSLGAILYEILVGRGPAPQLRLPSELSRIFTIEADEIILKSMAARSQDRYATVEGFKNAVMSLRSSLLNARVPEKFLGQSQPNASEASTGTVTPAASIDPRATSMDPIASMGPRAHASLDQNQESQPEANSAQNVSELETDDVLDPSRYAPSQNTEEAGNSWYDPAPSPPTPKSIEDSAIEDMDSGARTMMLPKSTWDSSENLPPMEATAEDGQEIHATTLFAPNIIPNSGIVEIHGQAPDLSPRATPWAAPAENLHPEAIASDEEDFEPVAAWMWVAIAMAGSFLVVLSAYFGLQSVP